MKKIIALLLASIISFIFCACNENNIDSQEKENNIFNNNGSEWYIKKREETTFDSEVTDGFIKMTYEYDSNKKLISEKTFNEVNGEFVQTLYKEYSYDDEGLICYISGCNEDDETYSVTLNKYYIDGYCVCNGELDGGEIAYYYKDNVLFKFEASIESELLKREFYDENGKAIRVEIEDWLIYEYKYDNDNLVELICSDVDGNISYKNKFVYDGKLLIKEISEINNELSENNYTPEKIDNNTFKCIASDNSYIIYVIDDFGNLISSSSYKEDGSLINKVEYVWEKK